MLSECSFCIYLFFFVYKYEYTFAHNRIKTKSKQIPNQKYLRQLDANAIMHLDGVSFVHLKNLRTLRIDGNMLQRVPTEALTVLPALEVL